MVATADGVPVEPGSHADITVELGREVAIDVGLDFAVREGNRTIGASSAGGMLLGTIFGVVIVPGLYYIFASLADGRKLIKKEDEVPLTEEMMHHGKKKNH